MTQTLHPHYGEYLTDETLAKAAPLPAGVYEGLECGISGPGGGAGWTASLTPNVDGSSFWMTRGTATAGRYVIQETTPVTVPIAGPDATNPRIDLIVGIHRWVAGPTDPSTLEPTGDFTPAQHATYTVVQGAPAALPNEPGVPDPWNADGSRAVILARVTVPPTGTPTIKFHPDTDLTTLAGALKRKGDQRHSGGYFRVAAAPESDEDVVRLHELTAIAALAMPSGAVLPYAGMFPPTGFLFCTGAAVLRATFAGLFVAIGTTYGAGDGTTTFNLPNMTGRVPIGADAVNHLLAATGGEETHTLTESEIPSHTHTTDGATGIIGFGTGNTWAGGTPYGAKADAIGSTGGGLPHENMPPYLALNYIIKT